MIKESEVRFEAFCGSGPGGQYRNRHANCVRAIHDATGTVATATSERSMRQNKKAAFEALKAKIEAKVSGLRASQRKARHDAKPDAAFGHAIRVYRACGKDQGVVDRRLSNTYPISTLWNGELDNLIADILRSRIES